MSTKLSFMASVLSSSTATSLSSNSVLEQILATSSLSGILMTAKKKVFFLLVALRCHSTLIFFSDRYLNEIPSP